MITILASLLPFAHAELVQNGEIPKFNAQSFRPAVDSYQFLWINDTSMGKTGTFNYRSTLSYANSPVVYYDYLGTQYDLLKSVTQMDVSAGFTKGKVRYALSAPVILQAKGESVAGVNTSDIAEVGLGEMMADVKLQLLDRNHHRLGMAVTGRSSLPTSTTTSPLGTNGFMFELEGGMDAHLGMSTLAVNVGHRQQPKVPTENITWGPQLYSRVGFGHPFHHDKKSGIALEYNVAALYSNMTGDGVAMEGMVSGWYAIHELCQLRLGLSKGLSSGMTTPDWRGVFSVSFLHKTEADTDADGVLDHADICPAIPEDVDGFEDEDGCPEPTTVMVRLMDHLGNEVREAHWKTSDGKFSGPGHTSFQTQGGTFEFDVDDTRYRFDPVIVDILDQKEQVIDIEVDLIMGSLKIIAVDEKGEHIDDATWSIDGVKGASFQPVGLVIPVAPGNHEVIVQAAGYRMYKEEVQIVADEVDTVTLTMLPSKVTKHLDILEKIYFKTNSHIIEERSFDLLNEVADVIVHHPSIELIHIEGHTDSQGKDEYNKKLSQDRADEVRNYLIAQGVEPERLLAVGYGEERPIDTNDTEEGRANNRRVIFEIKKRHGDDKAENPIDNKSSETPAKPVETPTESTEPPAQPK